MSKFSLAKLLCANADEPDKFFVQRLALVRPHHERLVYNTVILYLTPNKEFTFFLWAENCSHECTQKRKERILHFHLLYKTQTVIGGLATQKERQREKKTTEVYA